MNYNIDVNKFLIIFFVGIATIYSIYSNQENLASVCIGGLVGYLSKDITIPTINNEDKYDKCNNYQLENEVIDTDNKKDDELIE